MGVRIFARGVAHANQFSRRRERQKFRRAASCRGFDVGDLLLEKGAMPVIFRQAIDRRAHLRTAC